MESDDEDAQMHQMMGFSTFGNKPKHGKNREITLKSQGTSSNLTPLGHRTVADVSDSSNYCTHSNSEDMGLHERGLNEEISKWVAARLLNPTPPDGREKGDEVVSTPAELTTSNRQQPVVTTPQDPSTNPSLPLNVKAAPFAPKATADDDTASDTTVKPTYSTNDVRSEPTYWTSLTDKTNWETDVGYTSPWTGAEFTRKELKEYAVGKKVVKPDGEVVLTYFKPSFVEEDPWAAWAGMEGKEDED